MATLVGAALVVLRRARGSAPHAVRPGPGGGLRVAVLHLLDLPAGVPRQLPLARRDGGLHHRARHRGVHQPGAEDPRRSPRGRRRNGRARGGGAAQGDPGDLGDHRGLLRRGRRAHPEHSPRQPVLGGDRGRRLPDRPADEAVRAEDPRGAGGAGAADDPRRAARPPGEGRRRARQRDPLGAPGTDPARDPAGRLPAAAAGRPGDRGHSPVRRPARGPQLQQQVRLQGRRRPDAVRLRRGQPGGRLHRVPRHGQQPVPLGGDGCLGRDAASGPAWWRR